MCTAHNLQHLVTTYTPSLSHLFTEVRPFKGDHADVNRVGNKGLVIHEFIRSEGGDCVEEELSCLLEVSDGHTVQTLVDFQTIPPVPISPLLNKARKRCIER